MEEIKNAQAPATSPAPSRQNAPGIVKRSTAYFADPASIDPPLEPEQGGFNMRFDLGDIEALAGQIKTELDRDPASGGLLRALEVKREGDRFRVVDGKRRHAAITLLLKRGVSFPAGVPVNLVDKSLTKADLIARAFVANDGKAYNPMEEAMAYKAMRDGEVDADGKVLVKGMTIQQIGAAVGRKHMHVSQMLALIDADESVREALSSGAIGKTQAKEIASAAKGNKEAQKKLVEQAKAVGKNTKDQKARKAVKKAIDDAKVKRANAKGKTLKPQALDDEQLGQLGEKLSAHLTVLMKEAGYKPDMTSAAMREIAAKDEKLAAFFTFGAMEALKAAAGLKINLEL